MPPAWQQPDFLEPEPLVHEQVDSSIILTRFITNVVFTEALPKEHVLSYFVRTESDSSTVDVYDTLTSQTSALDGLHKGLVTEESQHRHIMYLRTTPRQSVFISLQKWEGVVLEVMTGSFLVRLVDLTRTGPDEEAELPLDEISEEDRPLVRPGAIFYWHIGYHTSYSGQRTRTSIIRFRRLPAWTREEIDAARREAEHLGESIGWQ